jgi:alkylated DNA repair dioxygenase AlkB
MEVRVQSLDKKADLVVDDSYLSPETADFYLTHIGTLKLIKDMEFVMFGKTVHMRRSMGFFSDESKGYAFSGVMVAAQPLTKEFKHILDHINELCGVKFNAILVNVYEGKDEYLSAHSDEKRTLASGMVAAICLGESRIFRVRNKVDKSIVADIPTKHGQFILMRGTFQDQFLHEIPKGAKLGAKLGGTGGIRVSLTFRCHAE